MSPSLLDITPHSSSSRFDYGNDFALRALESGTLGNRNEVRIYLVREVQGDGSVKIGIAEDPLARLAQLQNGNPRRLELVGHFAGTKSLEWFIHRELAEYRIQGEWFRLEGRCWDLVDDVLRSLCEMAEDMEWDDDLDSTRTRMGDWAESSRRCRRSDKHCRRGHLYSEHGRFHKGTTARYCRACERDNERRRSAALR